MASVCDVHHEDVKCTINKLINAVERRNESDDKNARTVLDIDFVESDKKTDLNNTCNSKQNIKSCFAETNLPDAENLSSVQMMDIPSFLNGTVNCDDHNLQQQPNIFPDKSNEDGDDSTDSSSDSSSDTDDSSDSDSSVSVPVQVPEVRKVASNESIVSNIFEKMLHENGANIDNASVVLPVEERLQTIGKVSGVVTEHVIVVKAYTDRPALDLGTAFFSSGKTFIGKIYETFGPVLSPYYVVNVKDKVSTEPLELDVEVFYAPENTYFTTFVLVSQLSQAKGSDASWLEDKEPPEDCVDYSDDEQERNAKGKLKSKRKSGLSRSEKSSCATKTETHTFCQRKGNEVFHEQNSRSIYHNHSTIHQNNAALQHSIVPQLQHNINSALFQYSPSVCSSFPPAMPANNRFGMPHQPMYPPYLPPIVPHPGAPPPGICRLPPSFSPPQPISSLFARPAWQNR